MLAETGLYALILGLIAALLQTVVPWTTRHTSVGATFARRAAYTQGALITLSFAMLITAHAVNDFSLLNVAENSHSGKPLLFAIAGAWGNHEGSMLLWGFVLSVFGAAFAGYERRLPAGMHATALALLGLTSTLFLGYILIASDPFARLWPAPLDGFGLNPLLQDVGLAIHPPLLYLGYVGFSVVFAMAGAALIRGELSEVCVAALRRWGLIAETFLTLGIGFGAWWSYYTLGWGGFWSWDPVENAALLPWLTALALIHATGPAKAGALKRWTLFLAITSFVFSLTGTFLVRSGVLVSVHSFATDPLRGMVILGLLAVLAGGGYLLFALKGGRIKDDVPVRFLSREGGLFIASLLAAAAALIVAIGTLYPLLLEGLTGARISVGAPYFNAVFRPLMLPVLALMAIAPRLGKPMQRLWLAAAIGVLATAAFWFWQSEVSWAGAVTGLGLFALLSSLNKKIRTGARLAHIGMAVMLIGIAFVAATSHQSVYTLAPGETVQSEAGMLKLESLSTQEVENYITTRAYLSLTSQGKTLHLTPERRRYSHPAAEKPVPAIHSTFFADSYAVLGQRDKNGRVEIALIRHPGQLWIFIGMALMALGVAGALIPWQKLAKQPADAQSSARIVRRNVGPVVPFVLILILVAFFGVHFIHRLISPQNNTQETRDVMIGKAVPDFSLTPLKPGAPRLSRATLGGKVSLINIFASWCVPCHKETPVLMKLKAAGVPVYGIAYRDRREALQCFLQLNGNPYTAIGLDDKGRSMMDFGAAAVPESYLVDKNGIIRWHQAGAISPDTLHHKLLPLIRRQQ